MKWELHTHTAQGSSCGKLSAAEVVFEHKQAGYSGIVITDHYNAINIMQMHGKGIVDKIDSWLKGYEEALKAGNELGVTVLFGTEARVADSDNDFLMYGIEPEFFYENPTLTNLDLPSFSELAKRYNALVIQAHPNRHGICFPVNPIYVDGYEVYSGNRRQDNRNELSIDMMKDMPGMIQTSGSDYHQVDDLDMGSMEFETDIRTSAQLIACLRNGDFKRT
ncbi:MAG TPA: PHP domain-containing protein [Candidatus Limiplasma sp.]|nr:PHP domain-containing protein [Candidatus Limiplasma sp.]